MICTRMFCNIYISHVATTTSSISVIMHYYINNRRRFNSSSVLYSVCISVASDRCCVGVIYRSTRSHIGPRTTSRSSAKFCRASKNPTSKTAVSSTTRYSAISSVRILLIVAAVLYAALRVLPVCLSTVCKILDTNLH